jgi:hypothetical protein
MCTLSFVPIADGYLVAMNRDEKLARPPASAPVIKEINGVQSMYPVDVEGGTWIAASSDGTTWALLNRNSSLERMRRSRGEVIMNVLKNAGSVDRPKLDSELLEDVLPFRLVRFSLKSRSVLEWIWDGQCCASIVHPWRTNHWFSSGESDELALSIRGKTVSAFRALKPEESPEWLRELHGSHEPERGAFSMCVHRSDARTVSYTEISISQNCVTMDYVDCSPCASNPLVRSEIQRLSPVIL